MKKIFTFLCMLLAFATAQSQSSTVVISQVYGGGGSAAGTFKSDYVELHNISTVPQDISGFKIIYGSSTGNLGTGTSIFTFPLSVIIPPGGYVLVASTAGAGLANLTPAADYTFTLAMSATAGKVAFGNGALVGGTTYATQQATGNVIDFVGYGTTNEFEGAVAPAPSTTTAIFRKVNGCTETNNNSSDFVAAAPVPRNSASPVSLCTAPTLTASPNITGLVATLGVASAAQSFNVSGNNLTPAAGNVTITPTAGLEISTSSTSGFASTLSLAYTAGALASTPIYVRIAATASQGALTGANVTVAGGGATNAVVTVAGGVQKNYYSNAMGNLNAAATWGDNTAGTTNPPADFTIPYAVFNIVNRTTTFTGGAIDISGVGSKIILGDGINPTTLETVVGLTVFDTIKATNTIDIAANSTFIMGNRVAPILGTIGAGTNVVYSYNGSDDFPVKINNATYHNLTLKNGFKFLNPGPAITTVNGDFVIDATTKMNGGPSPFSTVVLKGNLSMINNAAIEDSVTAAPNTGLPNRFTLSMAGNGTQNINTGISELRLFRLQRDTAIGLLDLNINVTPGSKIVVGNANGGDIKLTQKVATGAASFTTLTLGADAQIATARNGIIFSDLNGKAGIINATDAKVIINTSTTSSSLYPGTLRFTPTSTLKELTVNINKPLRDSILLENDILINNALNLTKGYVAMAAGKTLELANAATITGGSTASHVDGIVKSSLSSGETLLFPVGQAKRYAPVEITTAFANDFTVKYNKQVYSNTTVNAATISAISSYHISGAEHWLINQGTANTADVKFYYGNPLSGVIDPAVASIAHFNGTDWDDIGRTSNGTDANGTFISKAGITSFSPFTFGGANGVLPIILENFNGTLNNTVATLSWKTGCEDAGDAFELEYSTNGITFTNIYNTNAFGNCNGNVYKYNHDNANAGTNYYRLKMIAATGRVTFSNIVILKNGKNNFETKIVSTNNNTILGLSITSPTKGKGNVQIVNLQGQRIYNATIAYNNGYNLNYINTALWSNGMYLVNFTNENGVVTTVKYVK
jgi:Lamin Tail Domain